MQYFVSQYRLLPSSPGVYIFLDAKGDILYVGKAINLKNRVSSYFTSKNLGQKTKILVSQIAKIKIIKVQSEIESLLLEANLIKKYLPKYNINLKDGKAYPLIRITVKEKFPKVLIARREEDKNSIYFGPFPNSGAMRLVLKTLRRIFPFQNSVSHPNKFCLYYHLGLCPCPSVTNDPNYKKTISLIIKFLSGNTKNVIKVLEKNRDTFSKNQEYESANLVQKQIDAIKLVTSKFYKPQFYELNPNLSEDIRNEETELLKQTLNSNGLNVNKLERIECYDISNTMGKQATASMVVFINGEKASAQYRKFKIRGYYNNLPDDFKMISEVLTRRIKHKDWDFPDLIIIDGGKGQVSSAKKTLTDKYLNIPLIGLAKREETIILPNLLQISLPKDSKQLHLVMRIRDEAHRFAINYHKKLRGKNVYN